MSEAVRRRASRRLARVLVLLAVSVALEIVAQCLPPYRSPVFETESALAVGPYGALEVVSLCLRGGLVFALLGAASAVVPFDAAPLGNALLAYAAAAKFVLAFVATDLGPRPVTPHGIVHAFFAFSSFFAAAIGELLVARALPPELGKHLLSRLGQLTLLWTVFITLLVPFGARAWGLLERIETLLLLAWIALFASALRRHLMPKLARST